MTLDWVLQQIERRIEKSSGDDATYLIDFIPNLRYMLKLDDLFRDISALEKFEEKVSMQFVDTNTHIELGAI